MKLKVFYHVIDLPRWREITDEQMFRIRESGLLDNCELHINLHYNPESFYEFRKEWEYHPNIRWHFSFATKEDREHPTYVLMQQTALSTNEEFYCLYLHQKGITHFGKPSELPCKDWRQLMDWFNIVNWKQVVNKLDEGCWDTVGVLRQASGSYNKKGKLREHFSGNSNWYTASFLRSCIPALKLPREVNYQSQLDPNFNHNYKDDLEFYAGWNGDRGFGFFQSMVNHYKYQFPGNLYAHFFNEPREFTNQVWGDPH
jgi:hypothetical protein